MRNCECGRRRRRGKMREEEEGEDRVVYLVYQVRDRAGDCTMDP